MKYLLCLATLLLSGCERVTNIPAASSHLAFLESRQVLATGHMLNRFVTDEATCYLVLGYETSSLSCKWMGDRK